MTTFLRVAPVLAWEELAQHFPRHADVCFRADAEFEICVDGRGLFYVEDAEGLRRAPELDDLGKLPAHAVHLLPRNGGA